MKSYRALVSDVYNGFDRREGIEWSNFWYDKANKSTEKRYLIIGDSTARMVRSTLAKMSGVPVDLIGTSSILNDELFISQIDAFFSNTLYKYSAVFVQVGHHGRIGSEGGCFTEKDYQDYEQNMNDLIAYLKQYTDVVILESIFDAVVPSKSILTRDIVVKTGIPRLFKKKGLYREKYDNDINSITRRKNEIMLQIVNRGG